MNAATVVKPDQSPPDVKRASDEGAEPVGATPIEPPQPPLPQPKPKPKARRGFAAMDPKAVREIAHKGGKAAHAAGTAHEFTSEEARAAGRKGAG
jgi:hypothetical protein